MTTTAGRDPTLGCFPGLDSPVTASRGRRRALAAHAPVVLAAVAIVTLSCQWRWSLASTVPWQCDEIPLLVRFTGLCGHVTNEREAREFEPGFYSFYMGAMRSVRAPRDIAAIHTTTGFWVNLTTHLFGVTPGAGRLMPFVWSLVAVLAAAWSGWLVARSVPAACVAASLVALSPHAVAYAAQARGYSEATALAPLLLIALEYFRRQPDRWFRAALVVGCTIQLSLTVYTMWIYWVAPSLLLGVLILPKTGKSRQDQRIIRTVMVVTAVSVVLFMAFYTNDRLRQLSFAAAHGGITLDSAHGVWLFVRDGAAHVMAAPTLTVLLGAVGLLVMWRSGLRWWLALYGAGVVVPAVFTAVHGSSGYPRNFGYLVVPLAVLAGAGANAVMVVAMRRCRPLAVTTVTAGALLGGSALVYGDLDSRVRGIIHPDWGGAVTAIDRRPETVGPRWVCHSLANHWQINWYRDERYVNRCLNVPPGGQIEIVMGTQRDYAGREVVFQSDPAGEAILARSLPDWINKVLIDETISGVGLRRWLGTRISADQVTGIASREPMFALAFLPETATSREIDYRLKSRPEGRRTITFKPVRVGNSTVWSLITPAGLRPPILTSLLATAGIESSDIHWFRMTHPVRPP